MPDEPERSGRGTSRGSGVWALHTSLDIEELNLHLAALERAGLLGLSEVDGRATAWLAVRVPDLPVEGSWEAVVERDWHAEWQERLEPVDVGCLRIAPPWKAQPGDIVIEPAQAFGTGHHETTTGCLTALCERDVRGRSVLDVGTGTGVLAITAARLGAGPVVAVDTDPLAVAAAGANAKLNAADVSVRHGSIEVAAGCYDVVLANLDTATLARLAPALAARLARSGCLIASGVSLERGADVITALSATGLEVLAHPGREWLVVTASLERVEEAPRQCPGASSDVGPPGPTHLHRSGRAAAPNPTVRRCTA